MYTCPIPKFNSFGENRNFIENHNDLLKNIVML